MTAILLRLLSILLWSIFTFGHNGDKIASGWKHRLSKRELNWNANGEIVSNSGSRIVVRYLEPHSRCMPVDESVGATAFVLYSRNDETMKAYTGIFHFLDANTSRQLSTHCQRATLHAGAYFYFYNTCPEDDRLLVASGYCYNSARQALGFHSTTFNAHHMPYVDRTYYRTDGEDRSVNYIEENILAYCYNAWKNAGFPSSTWRCHIRRGEKEEEAEEEEEEVKEEEVFQMEEEASFTVVRGKRDAVAICRDCSCEE